MTDKLELIITSDGSHSLLNKALDETYHSKHGAVQESVHVFIKNGLKFLFEQQEMKSVSILEVGFGTGLNALLTAQAAQQSLISYKYCSLEAFPVEENIWTKLNYTDSLGSNDLFTKLHEAKWSEPEFILPNFQLVKLHTTLQKVELEPASVDIIYFDAFAPNKQPEMWEISLLRKVVKSLVPNGLFVTYCAKGQLKRDLRELGLEVETLSGPPGKKEMIRARKPS